MRILYIDIDSLRPDHLGCYGYHRNTSPNIDRIASEGVRFENCYYSNGPCLPSRTALFSGRFGIHTGVVDHLGTAADHFVEGPNRGFRSTLGMTNWMYCLHKAGLKTVTISSFAERHSVFNWFGGFSEIYNIDRLSVEKADDVSSMAINWIERNGKDDNWFLHVNFWDVHWPYRTPDEFGNPFENDPIPDWLTEEIRQEHWKGCGIQSAQDMFDFHIRFDNYSKQPKQASSMAEVRRMFDGYDISLRYVDEHIGHILDFMDDKGILEDTAIIISADHGEDLGELNIYAGHRICDNIASRIPLVIRWPGITSQEKMHIDKSFHYNIDLAATVIELSGSPVPKNWDGVSFAGAFRKGEEAGREYLVVEAGAGGSTRAIRFDDYICIRVYHDCYQSFPDIMLFDIGNDPHELHNLASERPDLVGRAMILLDAWYTEVMRTATHPQDPMWLVLHEGGPQDTRGRLPEYVERLRRTGRSEWADWLITKYPKEYCAESDPIAIKHAYEVK